MRCVWNGTTNTSPSNTAASYSFPNASFSTTAWQATENQRTAPISEDIIVTRLSVWLGSAPGSGASYAFTVRDDAADTAASITITGTNTTGTWTGAVPIAALSMLAMGAVPTTTPTTPGTVYWIIEYTTNGNFYLLPFGNTTAASTTVTNYVSPIGGYSQSTSTTATDWEVVIPTNATVTKFTAALDVAPGVGKNYALSIRTNNTTDSLTATVSDTNTTASATGSLALSPGDTLVIKVVPTGTPSTGRTKGCWTVVPSATGEIISAMGSASGPSVTSTTYQQPFSTGASTGTWNVTETTRLARYSGATFKKLYAKVTNAPGAGAAWIFTIRSNQASTSVAATISDTNTTGSDTTNTAVHVDGNFVTVQASRSGSPSSSGGAKFGFVQVIPQDGGSFFVMF
jgi:hypothetical protein